MAIYAIVGGGAYGAIVECRTRLAELVARVPGLTHRR